MARTEAPKVQVVNAVAFSLDRLTDPVSDTSVSNHVEQKRARVARGRAWPRRSLIVRLALGCAERRLIIRKGVPLAAELREFAEGWRSWQDGDVQRLDSLEGRLRRHHPPYEFVCLRQDAGDISRPLLRKGAIAMNGTAETFWTTTADSSQGTCGRRGPDRCYRWPCTEFVGNAIAAVSFLAPLEETHLNGTVSTSTIETTYTVVDRYVGAGPLLQRRLSSQFRQGRLGPPGRTGTPRFRPQ